MMDRMDRMDRMDVLLNEDDKLSHDDDETHFDDKLSKYSMDTLSVCSGDTLITQNTMDSNSNHNYHSCDNSHSHSCSSYISNMSMSESSISHSTPKSNSPAMIQHRISINGDVIDDNLTVLQLSNSDTCDTKDVFVMANDETKIKTKMKTKIKTKTKINTLSVPKWTTTTEDMESADEYDSEAHTQTDEDIIIKRVLEKCM